MTTFTKDMLRTGMRIKYNNGQVAIVLKDIGVLGMHDGFNNLSHLNDSLKDTEQFDDQVDWDVESVWKGYENNAKVLNFKALGDFIWKREEKSPEQLQLDILLKQISELNTQATKLQEIINVKA
ncbi:hypothetical protein [Pseudomonas sp.]|uniref:hypothetical protein n=1 Tax=Pseudomonas sp. TaxID=306 RepID=UPI003FD8756F